VVLVGLPNAGKSSLFNALAGGEAMVSEVPGTTRDYLTARVDFGGVPCELIDTAGVETGGDAITPHAQRQSRGQAERAQITLVCIDGACQAAEETFSATSAGDSVVGECIVILTKHDLVEKTVPGTVSVSVRTGHGIETLKGCIAEMAQRASGGEGASVASTAARAAHSVADAAEALRRALGVSRDQEGEELVAAELRVALDELGKVSGAVTTDDVLDRIFSRFCIGK
jgi:tRNA modification GTPase